MTDKEMINVLALRCSDPFFKEFPESTYELSLLRAKKAIALKYKVSSRKYELKYRNDLNNIKPIKLEIPDFNAEYRVKINNVEYFIKSGDKLEDMEYSLERLENALYFDYKPRKEVDNIQIYYISNFCEEEEIEASKPILPPEYDEEVLNYATLEVAKMGLAKYPIETTENFKKYYNLVKLYGDSQKLKAELLKGQNEWTTITPKSVI